MSERSARSRRRRSEAGQPLLPGCTLLRSDPLDEARAILAEAIRLYQPSALVGLFSGGHDSLCACHVASEHPLFVGCAHINTGIGFERTRTFVRQTCKKYGWRLQELYPPPFSPRLDKRRPGIDYDHLPAYESLVMHYGFPGPAGHRVMYNRLKERCLRRLVHTLKKHSRDRVAFVSGVRREESMRRMGIEQAHTREGCRVWIAPLINWTSTDKRAYMQAQRLPHNEIVEMACMSGECLCGAFARPGELADVMALEPMTAAVIRYLEGRCRQVGQLACRWGERPPQLQSDSAEPDLFSLCWSCGVKAQRETAEGNGLVIDGPSKQSQ
jgi:3'-phosphoadenosine 5'-phosphosulfate sulfotransferase (PAPS reductase)/FAD synthetase